MPVSMNAQSEPHETVDEKAIKLENIIPGAAVTISGAIVTGSAMLTGGVLGVLTGGVGLALGVAGAGMMVFMNGDKTATARLEQLELTRHQLDKQRQQLRTDTQVAVKQVIETAHELNQQKALQIHAVAAGVVAVDATVMQANWATTALIHATHPLQLALVLAVKNAAAMENELKRAREELAAVTSTLQSTQHALAEKDATLGSTIDAMGATQAQLTSTSADVSEQLMNLSAQPQRIIDALDKHTPDRILQAEHACLKGQIQRLNSKNQQLTQTITKLTACLTASMDENNRLRAGMPTLQANQTDAIPKSGHAVTLFRS